jgi:hypothetical protein
LTGLPVASSHKQMRRSANVPAAETSSLPSGEKAKQ